MGSRGNLRCSSDRCLYIVNVYSLASCNATCSAGSELSDLMPVPEILVVTPASSQANNGNWRTAARWATFLNNDYEVIVQGGVQSPSTLPRADLLIALHATRSHAAVASWRQQFGSKPVLLILTGTDLYRDLPDDARARESLSLADRLVVLQEHGLQDLPAEVRGKARVIYQSARSLPALRKPKGRLDCVFVGHLRGEKDPLSALRAWQYLPYALPIALTLIGSALDHDIGGAVRAASRRDHRIRWVGAMPHEGTLRAIQHAHVLINSSRMEGGAHVIVEAVRAGTIVLASRGAGNLGMLGESYEGYFEVGDARGLARALLRTFQDHRFQMQLKRKCQQRRGLFEPAVECSTVRKIVADLLGQHKMHSMEDL